MVAAPYPWVIACEHALAMDAVQHVHSMEGGTLYE